MAVALSDIEIRPVGRLQLVFLNMPETPEERVRRDEREKIRQEIREKVRREYAQRRMELRARAAAWYAWLKEAQEKGEPFDEPPPWE